MTKASELHVADVILSTTSAAVSKVIKTGTAATYSHAMRHVGKGNVVEDAFESQELTVSRSYPSMTNPGDIDEYSERNSTTFPKLGELELSPDMGVMPYAGREG